MLNKTAAVEVSTKLAGLSRIGQRRQVVIPKAVFDALRLREGDFIEITAERGHMSMKPKKLVDADDILTLAEAKTVKRGELQLKGGQARPWRDVKNALDRRTRA